MEHINLFARSLFNWSVAYPDPLFWPGDLVKRQDKYANIMPDAYISAKGTHYNVYFMQDLG